MADYLTIGTLGQRIGLSSTTEDARLQSAVTAASRMVDSWCGRKFSQDAAVSAAVFVPQSPWRLDLPLGWDISTATGVVVKVDDTGAGTYPTTLAVADYRLEPLNGVGSTGETGWPYTSVVITPNAALSFPVLGCAPTVQVTAKWGWAATPPAVTEAATILAEEIWKLKDLPFGAVSSSPQAEALLAVYRRGLAIVGIG